VTSGWSREQADKYAETGGKAAADMKGKPIILLPTVGAKTGKLRKTPVMRVEHNGEMRSSPRSAAPRRTRSGTTTSPRTHASSCKAAPSPAITTPARCSARRKRPWRERAVEAWPDYAEYQTKTDRQIPVFVLTPV
jgi:F420H(2)-dependent quinone reductase